VREVEFLEEEVEVGILSERRVVPPWGMEGGKDGARGKNVIIHPDGRKQNFGPKNSTILEKNARILILTPGGGGYGSI